MNDEAQRGPRSKAEAQMIREKQVSALRAARERGLRGKAYSDFAKWIGVRRTDAFRMIQRDYRDRGFGLRKPK